MFHETRLGANATTLPGAGLTRRGLLRGATPLAVGLAAAAVPAAASTSPLSANDARLIELADTLARHYDDTEAYAAARIRTGWDPDADPEWDRRILAYGPLEDQIGEIDASSMAGVLAKARAVQVPTSRNCQNIIAESLADDVWRLFGGGAA